MVEQQAPAAAAWAAAAIPAAASTDPGLINSSLHICNDRNQHLDVVPMDQ